MKNKQTTLPQPPEGGISHNLTSSKIRLAKQCDAWAAKGGKITRWTCPTCNNQNKTPQPKDDMVGVQGYWDRLLACDACHELICVNVYPSGDTKSKAFAKFI